MKRTPLLLTIGFFILLAGGITLYQFFNKKGEISIRNLIPEQTVLVYEIDNCEECSIRVKESIFGKFFERLLLNFSDSTKNALDILSLQKKGDAVSLHITSKDDFDAIYYFSQDQANKFENSVASWRRTKWIKFSERELNGAKIEEFSFEGKVFSCVMLDKIWVASFTPFLIEDVIRTFTSEDKPTFASLISDVYSLPRTKDDAGDVYINLGIFANWLSIFPEDTQTSIDIGHASLLDFKQEKNSIALNGFSLINKNTESSILSYFENQAPVEFLLKQYISNRTIFATTYGISDGEALYKKLELSKNKSAQDTLTSLAKIDFTKLFSSFGNEMSLCYQESKNGAISKVILFETEKPQEWLSVFDQVSKAVEKADTIFYEKYSTYEIREIEMNNFVGKLFSPLASGFSQTYYTWIGNTIILSEQLEEIKQFVDDIDEEEVWGKSGSFNKFRETTLLESNLSIYINTPLVWNTLSKRLNPRWKEFVLENQSLLSSFQLGAIQFSHLNESFYTNIAWAVSSEVPAQNQQSEKPERLIVSLNSDIIRGPFVAKSFATKKDEVLVQDSSYNLYHFSNDGKVIWSKVLDGPIVGDVKQIDFFNNGKFQFFFTTPKEIHVIDRLGNYVDPYPIETKSKDLEFSSVIDYDNSKKYRFLLADKSGRLWMYDKEMQSLDGWRPRNIENGLFAPARHHRIRGKDYILAVRKDGIAYLMNRKGELSKGFPMNLDARPEGDYYLEIGNSEGNTSFVCISRDGFRLKFNLQGKLLSRETLVKPSFETQFGLIAEQHGKSYLIKRQDAKRLSLLNDDGVELLSNDFVGKNPVEILYYDFGAGRIYITITDLGQDISFLYDGTGRLLSTTPIEGKSIVLRAGDSDLPKTYVANGNTLVIQ